MGQAEVKRKRRQRIRILWVSLLLFGLAFATPAGGQWFSVQGFRDVFTPLAYEKQGLYFPVKNPEDQEISLGPVVVRPGLGVMQSYSSNVTLTEDNPKEDYVTSLAAALLFELPYKRNTFEVDYLGDYSWFARNSRYDSLDHSFSARGRLYFWKDTQLYLSHYTGLVSTAVEDIPNTDGLTPLQVLNFDRRRRFRHHRSMVQLHYGLRRRLRVTVEYENAVNIFEKSIDAGDNFISHKPSMLLGYRILRKTRLLAGYTYLAFNGEETDPTSSFDHREHSAVYGLEWNYSDKIRADLIGTYNWLDYFKAGLSSQYWGARVQVRYIPRSRTTFFLTLSRQTYPAFEFTGRRAAIFYLENLVSLSFKYNVRHNLVTWLNFTYKGLRYERSPVTGIAQAEDILGVTGQVVYELRHWLFLGLLAGYGQDDSKVPGEGYRATRVKLYVQGAF